MDFLIILNTKLRVLEDLGVGFLKANILSFLEYKQKVQKTLQKHYDKRIGNDILLEELAEELGVELE